MKIRQVFAAASLLASVAVTPSAFAGPMTGTIGFGDGLLTNLGLPTAIVAGLTSFNPGATATVAPCTGDFGGLGCPTSGSAFSFSFGAGDQLVFTAGTFVFHVNLTPFPPPTTITPLACEDPPPPGGAQLCTDKEDFNGVGFVHDTSNTFADTVILISWALTGNCLDTNGDSLCDANWGATYSATITATGLVAQIPEPGSVALLGLGLIALGAHLRRRRLG